MRDNFDVTIHMADVLESTLDGLTESCNATHEQQMLALQAVKNRVEKKYAEFSVLLGKVESRREFINRMNEAQKQDEAQK